MKIKLFSSFRIFNRRLRKPVKNNRGVALIMTLAALNVILPLAIDLSQITILEYNVSSQSINRIRAYYAARAGAEIGLLRVLLFQKAQAQFGDKLGDQGEILDLIWQMPFEWPPTIPDGLNAVDTAQIKKNQTESFMTSKFFVSIEDEGQKIDINALGSPSKRLSRSVRSQIIQIFENKRSTDEDFEDAYRGVSFDEIVDNMVDWIDDDDDRQGGGLESGDYEVIDDAGKIPPNGPFRTLDEVKLVKGMNEELFRILKDRVTIFGVSGVNVNSAPAGVLISLDPQMNKEVADEIIGRRSDKDRGGPFRDEDDFYDFLDQQTEVNISEFNQVDVPLFFGEKYNFRVVSTGQHNNILREIHAVTYDFDSLKGNLIQFLDEEDEESGENEEDEESGENEEDEEEEENPPAETASGDDGDEDDKKTPAKKVPNGRPRVVFWGEF